MGPFVVTSFIYSGRYQDSEPLFIEALRIRQSLYEELQHSQMPAAGAGQKESGHELQDGLLEPNLIGYPQTAYA